MKSLQFAIELRKRAESYYGRDLNRAQAYARWMLALGKYTAEESVIGFAMMTQGDVLHFRGAYVEAWAMLEAASQHFLAGNDQVGWARTWLGRLNLGFQLPERMAEIEAHLPEVTTRLQATQNPDLLVRLATNLGLFRTRLGQYDEGWRWLNSGYDLAVQTNHQSLPNLCNQLGIACERGGELSQARRYYQQARDIFESRQQVRFAGLVGMNIALIEMRWGKYESALKLMQTVLPVLDTAGTANTLLHMALCWLNLGEYSESFRLINDALVHYGTDTATFDSAFAQLVKAETCIELARYDEAHSALERAGTVFAAIGSPLWLASKQLRQARLALRQENHSLALELVETIQASGIQSQYLDESAALLCGQIALRQEDYTTAMAQGQRALQLSRRANVREAHHDTHFLLGTISLQQGRLSRATRHFYAATFLLERTQNELGRQSRRGFLSRHAETHTALMRTLLQQDRAAHAFATLERVKSQLFLRYFEVSLQQRIYTQNNDTRALYDAREHARNQLAQLTPDTLTPKQEPELMQENQAERIHLQRQIRQLTQKIDAVEAETIPFTGTGRSIAPETIQSALDDETHLLEFYSDGADWWVFSLGRTSFQHARLEISHTDLLNALDELWQSLTGAIAAGATSTHPMRRKRTMRAATLIGDALFRAISAQIAPSVKRLIIVPFGALHYLPFALLDFEGQTVAERFELIVNPSSGLLLRPPPIAASHTLSLAYSSGNLLHVRTEVEQVQAIIGGDAVYEAQAVRAYPENKSLRILHIAAHARHDTASPGASYIQLADGLLYADDLVRFAPSCELVTLSGCETGRSLPAAGDDVIGIGAEFLRIGAGALLSSLWQADDAITAQFMTLFYRFLVTGMTKSGALQRTQQHFIHNASGLHPAFWAGFQLSGDPRPLSH